MEEYKIKSSLKYVHTKNMPDILKQLKISLLVTTYQAQRLLLFSPKSDDGLFMLHRSFEKPTGIAIEGTRMALVTRRQVWDFKHGGTLRDDQGNPQPYDLCYVPRMSFVTGDISGHEAVYLKNNILVVNTRFSCISALSTDWNFIPVWKPSFISKILPEDRCHLNGLACDKNDIRYVSALGESDTKDGWRDKKVNGGIVINAKNNEIVSRGISMPHSPRMHGGKLWILESGTGSLQYIDEKSGERTTVIKLPGYLRGLAFFDRFAFIGLSRIRSDRETFSGLPIEENHNELICGVHVVDLTTGKSIGLIEFKEGIEELFDVKILAGVQNPHIIGFEDNTLDGVFILPEAGNNKKEAK